MRGLGIFLAMLAALAGAESFKVGDAVEALSYGMWSPARVIEVAEDKWKVTYDGYSASWDEWVGADRIRRKGQSRPASVPKPDGVAVPGKWKAGDRVEAQSYGSWYPASVIEVGDGKWKVTYDGYGSGSDEWLPTEKIRPLRTGSWKKGDRVEALSYGTWYKATIIDTEESRWKVNYDGYSASSDEWVNLDRIRALGAAPAGGSDPAGKVVEKLTIAARPAGAKAGIEGAFLRVETSYFNGRLSLNNQGWFFTKDGKFSKAPKGGFTFKGFAPSRKTDGTYWIANGKITLAFADGSAPREYDFEDKGDEVSWNGLGSTRVDGFAKGWRFDGEYEGGASLGGGTATSTTITFARDGTFRRGSVGSVASTSAGTRVSAGASSEAAGTYEFDGYTLTMNEGGKTAKYTVFAFSDKDAAGRPEYIYRDGTMMKRQDRK